MKKIVFLSLFLAACARGPRGDAGVQGPKGDQGNPGVSCSVEQLENGALITCGESQAVIFNGSDGEDGQDALSGMIGIAEILNPCGPEFAGEEVLLKLSNGLVLALHDGGPQLDRLALLSPGVEYVTSDSHQNQCHFSIDEEGNLVD